MWNNTAWTQQSMFNFLLPRVEEDLLRIEKNEISKFKVLKYWKSIDWVYVSFRLFREIFYSYWRSLTHKEKEVSP